ncbi:alpha/beta hydrolase [Taklimakanibacter deserti]|uniref:alpha/beta hydrolase n=1 Tax=Taklimakanibacter deserti TaxID=2267839 RepID=UPI000E65E849
MSFDMVSSLRAVLVFAVAAYVFIAAFMYVTQRSHQYFPGNQGLAANAVGLEGVEDVKLASQDGETLQAWYSPAKPGKATILYLHGNGGEIADRAERFAAYQAQGFGVFFLSYRGYGASTGSPSETGLVNDARAAYDWLTARGVTPQEIMLVGESLGSGVAVQLAAERPVKALALEAPFASAANVAAAAYWWLPVRLLMKDKFDSFAYIGKIKAPLLIIHGDLDGVVPLSEGRALFAAANEPKEMIVIPDGNHGSIFSADTWLREMQFFDRYMTR